MIHRTHYTKDWLTKIYNPMSPSFFCKLCSYILALSIFEGVLIWSLWCPVQGNWEKYCSKCCDCIICVSWASLNLHKDSMASLTLLASRLIFLRWYSSVPPSHMAWVKEVLYHLKLEKIRLTLSGTGHKFEKTGKHFFSYVNSTSCPVTRACLVGV